MKTYEEFLNEKIEDVDSNFRKLVTKKYRCVYGNKIKHKNNQYYAYDFAFKQPYVDKQYVNNPAEHPAYITVNLSLDGTEAFMINGGLRPKGTVAERTIKDEKFSKLMDEVNKTLISWLPDEFMRKNM